MSKPWERDWSAAEAPKPWERRWDAQAQPEDAGPEMPEVPPEESGVLRRYVVDPLISLAGKGSVAAGEAVVGLNELSKMGVLGRVARAAGLPDIRPEDLGYRPKAAKAVMEEAMTPEQQQANRALERAQGVEGTLKAIAENPSVVPHKALESVPAMLLGGAVSRGVAAASPVVRGAAGEALVSAGSAAEEIRQETPGGRLTDEQAALAAASGGFTGVLGAAGGRIAQKLGIGDIDTWLAGAPTAAAKKAMARRVVEGAVSEGVFEELPQSLQEQIAQNIALGKPWDEGLGKAGTLGAVIGGVMGGGANVRAGTSAAPAVDPAAAEAQAAAMLEPENVTLPTEAQRAEDRHFNLDFAPPGKPDMTLAPAEGAAPVEGIDFPQPSPLDRAAAVEAAIAANEQAQRSAAEGLAFERVPVPRPELTVEAGAAPQPAGNEIDIEPFLRERALLKAQALDAAGWLGQGDILGRPFENETLEIVGALDRLADTNPAAVRSAVKMIEDFKPEKGEARGNETQAAQQPAQAAAPAPDAQAARPGQEAGPPPGTAGEVAQLAAAQAVDAAAHEAATSPTNDRPEPTDAQKAAGNYAKGHVRVAGFDIAIENPHGSRRRPEWPTLKSHYGYVKRSEGADGDQVDVFVKPGTPEDFAGPIFVVDQLKQGKAGGFDEHKVVVGASTPEEARALYAENYTRGFKVGSVNQLTQEQFRAWLKSPFTKRAVKSLSLSEWDQINGAARSPERAARLRQVAGEIGWAEEGGRLIRAVDTGGEKPEVTGRTSWIAKSDFWPGRPDKISQAEARGAIEKYERGERLTPREQRFLDYAERWLGEQERNARRKDTALRERVEALDPKSMTREQLQGEIARLRRELSTDALTGLGNRRALEQAAPKAVRANVDADALKWVNDNLGHEAGDQLLSAIGEAFQRAGVEAYHVSGDEFVAQFDSDEQAYEAMGEVKRLLSTVEITATLPDGSTITKTGVDFSYGLGQDPDTAEAALRRDKAERQDAGARPARGEEPQGVVRRAARQAHEGERAPAEVARPEVLTETPADAGVSASEGEEFALAGETESEIRTREAREKKEAEAKSRADRAPGPEGFTLTGSDRPADEARARGQMELGDNAAEEPQGRYATPQLIDVPAAGQRRPGFALRAANGQLDLFTAAPVSGEPQAPNAPEAIYSSVVEPAQRGQVRVGFDKIDSPEKAAHVFAALRKSPRERFNVLVLDRSDRPIAYLDLFAGAVTQTSVYPQIVNFAIYQTPGAASFWMSHNHPSGTADPSFADERLTEMLKEGFRGTGIEYRGHVIIAGRQFATLEDRKPQQIPAAARTKLVPIMERTVRRAGRLDAEAISSPARAKEVAAKVADGREGLVVMDAQNRPIGFIPMTQAQMKPLRTDDPATGYAKLARTLGRMGSPASVIYHHPDTDVMESRFRIALGNLQAALAGLDVKVLDAISRSVSMAERGLEGIDPGGPFFARGRAGGAGLTLEQFKAAIAKTFGARATEKILAAGIMVPVTGTSDIPAHVAQYVRAGDVIYGFYDPRTERTYAVLENLTAEMVRGMVMHEVGVHYGFRRMLGDNLYEHAMQRLEALHAAGDKDVAAARQRAQREASAEAWIPEETLAYLVMNRPEMSLVQRVISAIKAFLFREFGIGAKSLTADDFAALARAAVLRAAKGDNPVMSTKEQPAWHRAYHGTPHDFDRFSTDKIGTGEGAQAYGWGLYFAGKREVAEYYRKNLSQKIAPMTAETVELLRKEDFLGFDSAAEMRGALLQHATDWESRWGDVSPEAKAAINEWLGSQNARRGRLYEVELAPAEDEYLDWDKRLEEQSPKVVAALARAGIVNRNAPRIIELGRQLNAIANLPATEHERRREELTREHDRLWGERADLLNQPGEARTFAATDMKERGNALYHRVVVRQGGGPDSPEMASRYLASIGIPGIKYLDGSSRGRGEGHHNYVIFDDSHVEVVAKFARRGARDFDEIKDDIALTYPGAKPRDTQAEGSVAASANIPAPPTAPAIRGIPPSPGQGPWRPGSWGGPDPSRLDNLIYALQDKHVDTRRVVEAIQAAGRAITDATDPYLQEELFHGRAAKGVQDFLEQELKPLVRDMATRGVKMEAFEEWLHARHARERNAQIARINPDLPDGGSGMTNAEAARVLAQARSAGLERAYQALAARVDAINAKTRAELVAYGLEEPAAVAAWEAAYQHYVPLHREDMDSGPGTGQGFSVRGSQKRATGSTRAVVNILANVALARERAIVRGEKNRVAAALVGLAVGNPNPDLWRVDQPPIIKSVDARTGLVTSRPDPTFKSRDNVVVARIPDAMGNVVEHAVVFNDHDERARRMAASLKNLDIDDLGVALGTVAKATRFLAAMSTQYNPVFGVVNITRDVQAAMLNLTTTPLAGRQAEVMKHTLSALRGIYIDLREHRAGRQPTSAWAQTFEQFQRAGGKTGYRDLFRTADDRADALKRELARAAGKGGLTREAIQPIADWLSDYNEAMENAVRLAAYKVGLEHGMTRERAASVAKNLTVNFNRRGASTMQIGALYAFFNAAVQGTARTVETLKGPRGKQIIAGGVLLGVLQAVALAMADLDDDDPPDFVRERALVIPVGGKRYVTIPMPLGFHALPNLGRIATEYTLSGFKGAGKRVGNLLAVLFDAFSPMGSMQGLSWASASQLASPTVFDPVVSLAANQDWTGKPIAREDFNKLAPTPGHTRAKDTATEFAKAMSRAINALSGGSAYTPGVFSPTPDQIDYLIGQLTGGVGREISKASQSAVALATGEELPPYKIPLVGRFYGNAAAQASQAGRFYENLREIAVHRAEVKGRRDAGEPTEDYLRANPEARLAGAAAAAQRQVAALRKEKRKAMERGAPRERVRELEERMNQVMTRFNERVKEARQ